MLLLVWHCSRSLRTHSLNCCVCVGCVFAAGDLWLLSADNASTLLDAVLESFRIHDRAVSAAPRTLTMLVLQLLYGWGSTMFFQMQPDFILDDAGEAAVLAGMFLSMETEANSRNVSAQAHDSRASGLKYHKCAALACTTYVCLPGAILVARLCRPPGLALCRPWYCIARCACHVC